MQYFIHYSDNIDVYLLSPRHQVTCYDDMSVISRRVHGTMGRIVSEAWPRGWMTSILVLLLLGVSVTLAKPPHIVFIVADDLGWNDVGWHNDQMYTPNLDKLAMEGVRLNSSYVQPVCTPSRNCWLTGYYPFHTGLQHDVIHPRIPGYLPSNFTTFPEKLKKLGYETHIVGKWHLGFCNWKYTPTERGFDTFMGYYNGAEEYFTHVREDGYDFRWNKSVYHPPDGVYSAEIFAKHAIDIIHSVDPDTQPLYLYLPFQSVHAPLEVPKRFENIYKNITTKSRRTYCGMVSALDEAVGNITQALEDGGFMDDLLLVFTTDNGGPTYLGANNLPLRGAKTTLWEGGTKGAAFVHSKTLLKKTRYLNTGIFHAVDWFPTLLTLAGGVPDPFLDGINQWPSLSMGVPAVRTEFVYNIDDIYNNAAIRMGKYKMIQGSPGTHNGWTPLPHMPSPNLIGRSSTNGTFPPYQLFDLEVDPTEHFDIAGDHPDVMTMMKARLAFYRQSMVPAHYPPESPAGDPKHFGGVWSPGWC